MAKNEVTKAEEAGLPMVMDFSQDAGKGFDNLSSQDYAIPFISILQQLSPQLKRDSKVEGAEEGFIYNTVTQEIVDGDEGIVVVPSAYQKKYVEWKQREQGGGFVRHHDSDSILQSCTINSKGQDQLPNGNLIIPTAYYYVIIIKKDGTQEKAVLSMVSTQLKKAKKWNSIMGAIKLKGANGFYTPPMYSHSYRLTTSKEEKNSYSWYGWNVAIEGPLTSPGLYADAKKLNAEVEKGDLKAAPIENTGAPIDNASEVM